MLQVSKHRGMDVVSGPLFGQAFLPVLPNFSEVILGKYYYTTNAVYSRENISWCWRRCSERMADDLPTNAVPAKRTEVRVIER